MIRRKSWQTLGKYAILGLLLTGIMGWMVSCWNGPNTPPTPEIEFWTMQLQPKFTEYFNKLIDNFEAQNPNTKVRWVDVPWTAMESKILTAVSGKTAPDVVNLNPTFASQLAARQAWLDLDDKVTPEVRQQYLPNIWQASTLNGKSFGFPWYLTTNVTIYNTDLLKKAGITKPPTTFAELAVASKQIKDKTGKYASFATFLPQDSGEVLESFVQMGVPLLDSQGKAAFNNPQGQQVFQYWVDLYKQDLLPKEAINQGHQRGIELYQAGEIAMLSAGPEFIDTIIKNAPEIGKISAIAPQVSGKTGKKNVAVMNLIIPRDTKQPDAALKFALFVTNTENQLAFAKTANVLPSTVQAVAQYQKELQSKGQLSQAEQGRNISAAQLSKAEVLVPATKDINVLQKAIYTNLQAAVLGDKTVPQAASDAAKEWDGR
jgi:putative chitobiose transport system substrate-binding protein